MTATSLKTALQSHTGTSGVEIIDLAPETVPSTCDLARYAHGESVLSYTPFDAARMETFLYAAIFKTAFDCRVALRGGDVVGVVVRQVRPMVYSPSVSIGSTVFFVVAPRFRMGRLPLRLLIDFEEQCRADGAAALFVSNTNGKKGRGLSRLAAFLGYDACGDGYRKRLDGGALH